jgi:hypothetical protein
MTSYHLTGTPLAASRHWRPKGRSLPVAGQNQDFNRSTVPQKPDESSSLSLVNNDPGAIVSVEFGNNRVSFLNRLN